MSPPNGRVVTLCLVVVVLGAGCVSAPSSPATTSTPESPASAPPLPDRPANLSADAVVDYVTAYERATVYRDVASPGAEVTLHCGATIDEATADGYYAVAACGGSVTHTNGQHGDIAPTDHAYFVDETETVRIEAPPLREYRQADVYAATNESENLRGPAGLSPRGFEILNFDDADHTISVNVTYLNATPSRRIFSQSYTVDGHAGGTHSGVTARLGVYEVRVRVDAGEPITYRWRLTEDRATRVAIVVTPDGAVEIRPSAEPTL